MGGLAFYMKRNGGVLDKVEQKGGGGRVWGGEVKGETLFRM